MARFNEPIEPMTLGNMRANGVRSLAVLCHKCHHETVINADKWPGQMRVPSFGSRMVWRDPVICCHLLVGVAR
jgi:hypothetical protein